MVNLRCSHIEGTSKEENSGEKHRSNLKTERRRDAAKGIQYGIVTKLAVGPKNERTLFRLRTVGTVIWAALCLAALWNDPEIKALFAKAAFIPPRCRIRHRHHAGVGVRPFSPPLTVVAGRSN